MRSRAEQSSERPTDTTASIYTEDDISETNSPILLYYYTHIHTYRLCVYILNVYKVSSFFFPFSSSNAGIHAQRGARESRGLRKKKKNCYRRFYRRASVEIIA